MCSLVNNVSQQSNQRKDWKLRSEGTTWMLLSPTLCLERRWRCAFEICSAGLKTTVFVGFQEASHKQKSFHCPVGRGKGVFWAVKRLNIAVAWALITVPVRLLPLPPPPHTLMPAICCRLLIPREFRKTQPRSKTTRRPQGLEPVDHK